MAARGNPPASVGSVLDAIFQRLEPEERRGIHRVWRFWREEVGEAIAERAEPAAFRGGVLSVRVNSPVWMQELQFLKESIRERLNQRLGRELIRDIYFVAGAVAGHRPALVREEGEDATIASEALHESEPVTLPPLRDPRLAEVFERLIRAHRARVPGPRRKTRSSKPR